MPLCVNAVLFDRRITFSAPDSKIDRETASMCRVMCLGVFVSPNRHQSGRVEVVRIWRQRNLHQGASSKNMRPKKVILCVDDNEQELSVLKFMLATNGYRVVSATNGQEAIGIFAETAVDLVLADYVMPQMNGSQLVERLKQIASHVPMILLGDPQKMAGEMHAADALLAKKNCSSQELLERIKVMSARKRGPRKGSQRMAPVVELAVAS
jgi:CheY-like chemotaxis protein